MNITAGLLIIGFFLFLTAMVSTINTFFLKKYEDSEKGKKRKIRDRIFCLLEILLFFAVLVFVCFPTDIFRHV